MRKSCLGVLVGAATFTLASCGDRDDGTAAGTLVFVDSLDITTIEHPGSAAEDTAPFALEGAPSVRIGAVTGDETRTLSAVSSARRLVDGRFVLVDRQARAVRMYDRDGEFLRNVGGVGGGPGEYAVPERVFEDGSGGLIVWDPASRRIVAFGTDGALRNDPLPTLPSPHGPDLAAISLLPDGGMLWVSPSPYPPFEPGRVRAEAVIFRLSVGADPEVLTTFAGPEADLDVMGSPPQIAILILSHWFLPQLLAASTPHGIWTSDGMAWELTRRNVTGDVDRVVRFRREREPLDPRRLAEIHASELEAAPTPQARENARIRQERSEYPSTLPPIRDLFSDELGRVWIGILEIPVVDLPSRMGRAVERWLILDGEGEEVVGTLALPSRSRPLYADGEGILLVRVDDLDVPYVEWWRYRSGPETNPF